MMHEHDFELIAEIAQGDMGLDERSAAEATLCETCRIELQLQREALHALRASPVAAMTDLERARVRRRVAESVFAEKAVTKPSVPWFQRLVPAMAAAAALLVVVGVGSVLVDGSGEGDLAADTSAAADTTADGESLRTGIEEEAGDGSATEVPVGEAPTAAELDELAGAAPTTIVASAPLTELIEDFGPISSDVLVEVALSVGTAKADDLTQSYAPPSESADQEPALVCAESAGAEGTITAIGRASVDGDDVEIYRIGEVVYVFAAADCTLTETFE